MGDGSLVGDGVSVLAGDDGDVGAGVGVPAGLVVGAGVGGVVGAGIVVGFGVVGCGAGPALPRDGVPAAEGPYVTDDRALAPVAAGRAPGIGVEPSREMVRSRAVPDPAGPWDGPGNAGEPDAGTPAGTSGGKAETPVARCT